VQIDLHGGENSAVAKQDLDSTAYAHRDFLFMFLFYDRVDQGVAYPSDGHTLMQNFAHNITADMDQDNWGMYINYPDQNIDQGSAQRNYWGKHLTRLRKIKKKVDPDNLFHYPQGVLPETEE